MSVMATVVVIAFQSGTASQRIARSPAAVMREAARLADENTSFVQGS
jgi:hypothetical protein